MIKLNKNFFLNLFKLMTYFIIMFTNMRRASISSAGILLLISNFTKKIHYIFNKTMQHCGWYIKKIGLNCPQAYLVFCIADLDVKELFLEHFWFLANSEIGLKSPRGSGFLDTVIMRFINQNQVLSCVYISLCNV